MASDKNWLQIRILHQKIHRIKEKKTFFFYMTLNDNNTIYSLVKLLFNIKDHIIIVWLFKRVVWAKMVKIIKFLFFA